MSYFPASPRPMTTPWGAVHQAEQIIPGVWQVLAARGGGLCLSEARQAGMPDALRLETADYNEACDWSLVFLAYEEELTRLKRASPGLLQLAHDSAKCWHAARYEKHTGAPVPENASQILRDRQAYLDAIGQYCTTSAWGDWADWVPKGKTGAIALPVQSVDHLGRPTYGEGEIFVLIDAQAYDARRTVLCLRDVTHEVINTPEAVRPKRLG